MTRVQAIELYKSKFWENLSYREMAKFQLFERRLCMPFDLFHKAVEESLGRPVWTHEFSLNIEGLRKAFLGEESPPSLEDIINLIPKDKRWIL